MTASVSVNHYVCTYYTIVYVLSYILLVYTYVLLLVVGGLMYPYNISLFLSLTCAHTSLTYVSLSFFHSLSVCLSICFSFSFTHTNIHFTHMQTHAITYYYLSHTIIFHSLSLPPTHSHTHSLSLSLTHSHSHSLSLPPAVIGFNRSGFSLSEGGSHFLQVDVITGFLPQSITLGVETVPGTACKWSVSLCVCMCVFERERF